jgi:hypothetical protein
VISGRETEWCEAWHGPHEEPAGEVGNNVAIRPVSFPEYAYGERILGYENAPSSVLLEGFHEKFGLKAVTGTLPAQRVVYCIRNFKEEAKPWGEDPFYAYVKRCI